MLCKALPFPGCPDRLGFSVPEGLVPAVPAAFTGFGKGETGLDGFGEEETGFDRFGDEEAGFVGFED